MTRQHSTALAVDMVITPAVMDDAVMSDSGHGHPVTFDTFGGFYYAGRSQTLGSKAVLLLSAIGFEEMCARTTWRALAEKIAAAGHACLRFDYPGTADAIDVDAPDGIADWLAAAHQAIRFLRIHRPDAEIVVVGQGFGGSLAAEIGPSIPGIAAAVLMAPAIKGRSYLRELQGWTRVLTERIGITPDPHDENGYNVAGFPLATSRADAIRAVDLTKSVQAPAAKVLLVERNHNPIADSPLAKHLGSLGAEVSAIDYAGYELILTDPTQAAPPDATLDRIVAWIDGLPRTGTDHATQSAVAPAAAKPIIGAHFEEQPVRFGPDGRLFGILCRPRATASAIAVLANAGRDYHIGWGRASVEQARALAAKGIASLRFDAGGIGDSPAAADAPSEIIYSEQQVDDLRHAIDFADMAKLGPIAVVGRCSGAYAAFNAAVRDARVREVVVVNIERFVWDPRESVEEALRYGHRSVGDFGATLLSKRGVKRLLAGELRVVPAVAYVAQRMVRQAALKLAPISQGLSPQGRLYKEVHRRFQILEERKVRVSLLFSMGDLGLNEFRTYMGENGERLRRYSHASVSMIPEADHNFTHSAARARLTTALCELLTARHSSQTGT